MTTIITALCLALIPIVLILGFAVYLVVKAPEDYEN